MMENELSPLPIEEPADTSYLVAKVLASIYLPGPVNVALFSLFRSPLQRRFHEWYVDLDRFVRELAEKVDGFSLEQALEDEAVVTAIFKLTNAAMANHDKEKIELLRNALLNSMRRTPTSDSIEALFIELVSSFTVWHIKILKLFRDEKPLQHSSLHIEDPNWSWTTGFSHLVKLVHQHYPQITDDYYAIIPIVEDLRLKGLISNNLPDEDGVASMHHWPVITPLGNRFLDYLKSPLEE